MSIAVPSAYALWLLSAPYIGLNHTCLKAFDEIYKQNLTIMRSCLPICIGNAVPDNLWSAGNPIFTCCSHRFFCNYTHINV